MLTEVALKRVVELGPTVHYVAKASGDYGVIYISSNVQDQLGYMPDQFTRESGFWASLIHPNDRPRIFADLATIFDNDRHVQEYRFLDAR